jgi:hypothetical protein
MAHRAATDDRELSATERGFLLRHYLQRRRMTTAEIADALGYRGYSGAANMLYRLRAGVVRDDDGYWRLSEPGTTQGV